MFIRDFPVCIHFFNLYLGFWQKVDHYQEQPEIHFQHDLVVLMETENPMRPIGWSTFKNYNQLLLDNVRVPMIKVTYQNTSIVHLVSHDYFFM